MQLAVWIAGGLIMLASATAGPRISIRVWRDPAYADKMTQAGRVLPFGYATSRGVTRGTLPLWTGIGLIGAGTLAAAALSSRPVHGSDVAAVAAVIAGLVVEAVAAVIAFIVAALFRAVIRNRHMPPSSGGSGAP